MAENATGAPARKRAARPAAAKAAAPKAAPAAPASPAPDVLAAKQAVVDADVAKATAAAVSPTPEPAPAPVVDERRREGYHLDASGMTKRYAKFTFPDGATCAGTVYAPLDAVEVRVLVIYND